MRPICGLVMMLLVTGCAGKESPAPLDAPDIGGTWHLRGYGAASAPSTPVAGTGVTITFDPAAGSVSGSAGCNTFSGSLTMAGNTLSIGPIALTKKFCVGPKGIMEQEDVFVGALAAVTHYSVNGDGLTLLYGNGDSLRFESAPGAGQPDRGPGAAP